MKTTFIQYKNLGKNLGDKFNIYSEKGLAIPSGVSKQQLLNGVIVDIDDDALKVFITPKIYDLIASGNSNPQISGLRFYKTDLTFNSSPIYYDQTDTYAISRLGILNTWFLSTINRINGTGLNTTSPSSGLVKASNSSSEIGFYFAGPGSSGPGTNLGPSNFGLTGLINISSLSQDNGSSGEGTNTSPFVNKLHVYNTPGITGFAGTYTSGVFTIGGIQRVGFRNDQNSRFYIIKNNLPSVWRAVEWPLGFLPASMTWYSSINKLGVDEDPGQYPPVTGWQLGDTSIMSPVLVGSNASPPPEMNFGHCPGNTLDYPVYVYQASTSDPSINGVKFYSGGALNNSGASDLFPTGVGLSDMFPDLYNTFFDKKFYYTNTVDNNRLFLFRAFQSDDFTKFYITRLPQNFNSGFYYWEAGSDIFLNTGINTLQQARKIYKPLGNNPNNLKDISININPVYLNKFFDEDNNFNLNNFTGNEFLYITNNTFNNNNVLNIQGIYQYSKIQSGQYSGLNQIIGEKCIFANPEFKITGARCFDSSTNIWSLLDNNFNFLKIQNCQTMSNVLPAKNWFTGIWSGSPTRIFYNFGITNLYSHNVDVFKDPFSYILYLNTGYNYNKISGIFNLSSGQQFVFDLDDNQKITGGFGNTIGNYSTFGNLNNLPFYYKDNYYNTFQSGVISTVTISFASKRISYSIYKSGVNTKITKFFMPYIPACCRSKKNK
jgi:hypothetical protein